jgi:hypothetical protein
MSDFDLLLRGGRVVTPAGTVEADRSLLGDPIGAPLRFL